jgi:peptidoglycan/LPS O-acetylase OafA/YrhL
VVAVPDKYSILGVIETIFFVHGFDPRNFNFIVPGGWSIAVEMQFYIMFPILFFIKSNHKPIIFIIFVSSVLLILLLIKCLLIYEIQPIFIEKGFLKKFELEYNFLNASLLNQLSVFLMGIICYQCIYLNNKLLKYSNRIAFLAIPLVVVSCFLLNSHSYTRTPFVGFIYPAILAVAFSLIAIKLATINDFNGRISELLIGIGRVSFSMYITHFFILDVVYFFFYKFINHFIQTPEAQLALMYLAVLSLTFFISKFTYKNIEKKGIELGDKLILKVKEI